MMKIYRKSEREIGRRMEGETKGRMREERWQSKKRERLRKTRGYEEMKGGCKVELNTHTILGAHFYLSRRRHS